MPETNEVWIRVAGMLVICIGFYYNRAGANNITAFLMYTVIVRVFVFICLVAFVLLNFAAPILAGFGVVDLICAIWTWSALKKEKA